MRGERHLEARLSHSIPHARVALIGPAACLLGSNDASRETIECLRSAQAVRQEGRGPVMTSLGRVAPPKQPDYGTVSLVRRGLSHTPLFNTRHARHATGLVIQLSPGGGLAELGHRRGNRWWGERQERQR